MGTLGSVGVEKNMTRWV